MKLSREELRSLASGYVPRTVAERARQVLTTAGQPPAPLPGQTDIDEALRRCCCSPGVTSIECPEHGGAV